MSRLHGFVCSSDFSLQKIPPLLCQHFYSEGKDSSISDCFSASLLRAAVADGPERQLRLLAPRSLFLLHSTSGLASSRPERVLSISFRADMQCWSFHLCPQDAVTPEGCFTGRGVLADHSLVFHLVDLLLPCYCERQRPALM